jgi:hypothetical protein
MAAVARRGLIAIGRDKRVRSRPAERQRIIDCGLRYIWIAGKRDQDTWEWMCRVTRHWASLESLVTTMGDGPWIINLNQGGPAVSPYSPKQV